jgi:hypothetical protein
MNKDDKYQIPVSKQVVERPDSTKSLEDMITAATGRKTIQFENPFPNLLNDQYILGKNQQDVVDMLKAMQKSYRIASKEGEHYMLTTDYKPERINLHIKEGKVTSYTFG